MTDSGYAADRADRHPRAAAGVVPGLAARGERKPLRTAIAVALQGDRTSDSVVPAGVPDTSALPAGRQGEPEGDLVEPDPPDPRLRPDHARRAGHRHPDPHPAGGHRRAECPAARPATPDTDLDRGRPQGLDGDRRWPGCSPTSTHRCPRRRHGDRAARRRSGRRPTTRTPGPIVLARCSSRPQWTSSCCRSPSPTSTCYTRARREVQPDLLRSGLAARALGHHRWLTAPPTRASPASGRGPLPGRRAGHPDRRQGPAALDPAGRGRAVPHRQGRDRARRPDRRSGGRGGAPPSAAPRTWRCGRC